MNDQSQSPKMTKRRIFPDVPEVFTNEFPQNYRPWVDGWSFSEDKLKSRLSDGTYTLITLDISINSDEYIKEVNSGAIETISERAEEKYKCEIGCKHCFECKTDTNNTLITFDELKNTIGEAKLLGLETVKFLGPGELLHNTKLFEILDYFENQNLKIGIFTKGIILGDDELSQKLFQISAQDFCKKLYSYNCVRLLIGFTSADPETEYHRLQTSVENFSEKRNRGIENMTSLGMNKDPQCQRMALACLPILQDNIDEAFEIFKWGIKRNIPVIVTSTMISGKGLDMPEIQNHNFKSNALVNLYINIYSWLIEQKIMTLNQIEKEGVSSYAGFACNQFICGMFIRKDGRIQGCPGNETKAFRYCDDIRKDNLKSVWKNCMGYNLRKQLIETGKLTISQPCYAKTESNIVPLGSISKNFYQLVIDGINNHI